MSQSGIYKITNKIKEVDGSIMPSVFLLDIDGVLCEAQQPVGQEMQKRLLALARQHQVYFVTGNSYVKSVDLLAGHIKDFSGVFCHSADELRSMRGKLIWQDTYSKPLHPEMESILRDVAEKIKLRLQNNSIEWRSPRILNFCPIGRFATQKERDNHDASWRESFIKDIMFIPMGFECSIGGKVSIDIYSSRADKSRAAKWINAQGKVFTFIGDKTAAGGNDYPVKEYCINNPENICLQSNGVAHTLELIDGFLRRV